MAEFLLELLSEEIPAGMQVRAHKELKQKLEDALGILMNDSMIDAQVLWHGGEVFSTPCRLTVFIYALSNASSSSIEERKGPRVGVPQEVIDKVCNSWGIKRENLYEKDGYYFARIEHKGREIEHILEDFLPNVIRDFTWQKSMLWGDGDLRWARPLHSISAVLIKEGVVRPINFEVGGIKSGGLPITSFKDYLDGLKKAGIILDREERKKKIVDDARDLCSQNGVTLVGDESLIDEITGLVESPFCIIGKIEERFQNLPTYVLQSAMKTHQKFLSVQDNLGNIVGFITVANKHNPSESAQQTILAGNQRVLSARLADAQFFWQNDIREANDGMKTWADKLQKMTFHNKLGTQADRVNRIAEFAKSHAITFGVNPDEAEIIARRMKLDLCSEMVGEYPELQGMMGFCYCNYDEYEGDNARAFYEHYMSIGLLGLTPTEPMSIAMAMSDKLDTLAGFWSVELTPTSSKDPFALRRAALGVIRLILDNNLRLSLTELLDSAFKPFPKKDEQAQTKLMDFFHERLKIYLRDKHDIPADTIDACRFGQGETDFALLTNRAKALHAFRPDAEFQNLLQGFKRAHNILHAEQKKDGVFYEMPPEPQYFQDPTETELHEALNAAETTLPPLMQKEQFAQMLQTLANLRAPIDAFFTQVQVNSDQSAVRRNRLCLLHKLCSVMKTFADFSRLNG